MRIDLRAHLEEQRAYSRINIEQAAQVQRNLLLHASARTDLVAAYHEAAHFLENEGCGVGPWVLGEQVAQERQGHILSAKEAAEVLVETYRAWAHEAAEIAIEVRSAELRLSAASSVWEMQEVERSIVWPKKPWNTSGGFQ